MADSKKYDGSTWEHSLRKLTTATADIEPTIYTDGTAITAYTIKGNTTQSGTPTPSNPITISGVGNKTANLLDMSTVSVGYHLDVTTGLPVAFGYNSRMATLTAIDVSQFSAVTLAYTSAGDIIQFMYSIFDGTDTLIERVAGKASGDSIDVSSAAKLYIAFYRNAALTINSVEEAMLNEGVTPQSYEPYGYKIPISSGGVTTNIYLTEQLMKIGDYADSLVSTGTVTYNIKKLVLTGDENVSAATQLQVGYRFTILLPTGKLSTAQSLSICTHFVYNPNWTQLGFTFGNNDNQLFIMADISGVTDTTTFASWLATQYANGTPVTIYFVKAAATTETITAPSIPTTEGANSITVDTTVQPSEFTATWTGWHDAEVKEKSENLFDMFDIVGQVPSTGNGALVSYNGSTTSFIPINSGNVVVAKPEGILIYLMLYAANGDYIGYDIANAGTTINGSNISGYENARLARLRIDRTTGLDDIQIMLNTGSTALPYEPYWK